MNNSIEVLFDDVNSGHSDLLIALLSNYGFDGFEESGHSLKAYMDEVNFDIASFVEIIEPYQLNYEIHTILPQNWNTVWENQFEPVLIKNFAGIRAHFHPSFNNQVEHEIIITPKMSFGTGHHATTWMMMEQMQYINFENKQVLDFGTGTGILAILSEKLGAAHIFAIDIDEWCIENAKENTLQNNCHHITIQQTDSITNKVQYDVILANINKNIILQHIHQLSSCLNANGCLLLSGLLADDEASIIAATSALPLTHHTTTCRQQWIAMRFTR